MTERQPSMAEVRFRFELESFGPSWASRGRWPYRFYDPICSDITEKCADCNCVLRDKRDAPGMWATAKFERADLMRLRFVPFSRVNVCLSCFNRRAPMMQIAHEWNETRKLINKTKENLRERNKNNRTTPGTFTFNDGTSQRGAACL